jgi:rare lipoprotein A
MRVFAGLLALAVLASCARPAPPPQQPRYHLGEPYRAGPLWAYPREDFALDEMGVAALLPRRSGTNPPLTVNGERQEDGLFAAHPTLQLPAVVTVTNLENGRALRVRVNDRGPAEAGRIIAIAPRAAALLGAAGPFQARVVIDAAASRAAIEGLTGQGPALPITAAPVGEVGREALAPPPGARGLNPAPARVTRPAPTPAPATTVRPPERLPEQVVQGPARPGQLWIEAGTYFRRDFAEREAGRISLGRVEPLGVSGGPRGRQQQFRVRAGPFRSVAEADAALARAIQSGLAELRLVVE